MKLCSSFIKVYIQYLIFLWTKYINFLLIHQSSIMLYLFKTKFNKNFMFFMNIFIFYLYFLCYFFSFSENKNFFQISYYQKYRIFFCYSKYILCLLIRLKIQNKKINIFIYIFLFVYFNSYILIHIFSFIYFNSYISIYIYLFIYFYWYIWNYVF